MLEKVSVFFVLFWLLFLVCPLYGQDTPDVALEVAKLKEQVQKLHEQVQGLEKKHPIYSWIFPTISAIGTIAGIISIVWHFHRSWKDKGKIEFRCEMLQGTNNPRLYIVNVGRQPVTIMGIHYVANGADYEIHKPKQPITLAGGDYYPKDFYCPDLSALAALPKPAEYKCLYALDSFGKRHKVKGRKLKKFLGKINQLFARND